MSLASRLPYTHPYAGGYPSLGSQPLPTDADAIDYLSRMATADGAGVETGVAVAVDAFITDSKALGVWDSIRSSCILAGARTLAGALVPLKNEGPELWDDPNPSFIVNSDGSAGTWDAATNTMVNAAVSTSNARPRFDWGTALPAGKTVRITGRFSGDVSHVYRIAAGTATVAYQSDINPDGSFAATVVPTSSALYIYIDGTLAPTSVTIESLSIREVIDDPVNSPVGDGFASGDYSRTAGLTGDGTSYIDSGRANDADQRNDNHLAVYITEAVSSNEVFAGVISTSNFCGRQLNWRSTNNVRGFANSISYLQSAVYSGSESLIGVTRENSTQQSLRVDGTTTTGDVDSADLPQENVYIFARNDDDVATSLSDATFAFYSVGTSLSLADLETAVSNLITRLKFALLTGENPAPYDIDTVAYVVRGYENGGTLE